MATQNHLFAQHARRFDSNRFVYPVISRRSAGLSIGINLNPDKVCNFDCIYCQVDRTVTSETRFVAMPELLGELDDVLALAQSGELFGHPRFSATPPALRRLNDIAFSGDGEPTTYRNFDAIMEACAERKRLAGADQAKMVLITNASMFHRPHVQRGLEILDANHGEIWAKLDAGTEEYFRRVDRTSIPFSRILDNILAVARVRPIVIQSLFMRIAGEGPDAQEIDAYSNRLQAIVNAGGQIRLVQIYTVARRPAESYVKPLMPGEVDHIVERVARATGLECQAFYGPSETSDEP